MQKRKTVYKYVNGELLLVSGDKTLSWKTPVNTFADITITIPNPIGLDAVVVKVDETRNNQPTQYYHNGYAWVYNGIYFAESLAIEISNRNSRPSDIDLNTDYNLPLKYVVGSAHLEIFLEEIELVRDVDYVEVGTSATVSDKIQFKITVPKEARLIFKRNIANKYDETMSARRGKVDVYYFDKFSDVLDSKHLIDEGQVIRTFGHTVRNDGKGRYWILEATDKDFAYRNKANTFFINRLIGADEVQIGTEINLGTGQTPPPEYVHIKGQIANRADFKRIWEWANVNGKVVNEAAWNAGEKGCFSSGDGSTTFRFPEGRGYFHRAFDDAAGVDTGRVLGNIQSDAIQEHRHSTGGDGTTVETGSTGYNLKNMTVNGVTYGTSAQSGISGMNSTTSSRAVPELSGGTIRTAQETRPKNISKIYYMKI